MTVVKETLNGVKITFDGFNGNPIALANPALIESLNVAGDAQRLGLFEQADEILRQVVAEYVLADLPVEVLCPLPVRSLYTLLNRSFFTVGAIVCSTRSELLDVRGFGLVSLMLLGSRLRALKLNLIGQHDYAWVRPLPPLREYLQLLPTFTWLADRDTRTLDETG